MAPRFAHACSEAALFQSLVSSPGGLSSAAAAECLCANGPNRLRPARHAAVLAINVVIGVATEWRAHRRSRGGLERGAG